MISDPFLALHQCLISVENPIMCLGAESCTGGQVAARITALPGASAWFWASLVVYANQAKSSLLGVSEAVLERYGAVSSETVKAMLLGLDQLRQGSLRYAISGIAGPGGASAEKPLGLVYIGVAYGQMLSIQRYDFSGNRQNIQEAAVEECGHTLLQLAKKALCGLTE